MRLRQCLKKERDCRLRIDSLGLDVRVDYNRRVCKTCGRKLSTLLWSQRSMCGIMVCTNSKCIARNQPQTFADFEKVRSR